MNFFYHKDLGNHLLQLCPKVVKHPVYVISPLLFLLYIIDLPGSINNLSNLSKLTLFADDTNIIFTHPNPSELEENINIVFKKLIRWFHINSLSLNLNKTYYMQFSSKTNCEANMTRNYKRNPIINVCSTNFLGLTLDSTLIVEASYRPTRFQTEFCLLCD